MPHNIPEELRPLHRGGRLKALRASGFWCLGQAIQTAASNIKIRTLKKSQSLILFPLIWLSVKFFERKKINCFIDSFRCPIALFPSRETTPLATDHTYNL